MKVLSKRQMENINGGMIDTTAFDKASMALYSQIVELAIQFQLDTAIVKAAKDKATQISS